MLLWIGLAILSAGVLAALLQPLLGSAPGAQSGAQSGAGAPPDGSAIYRDQLREIEGERERGLLGPAEAEAARAEVARRLIALDQNAKPALSPGLADAALARIAVVLAAGLPMLAIGLYLAVGAPFVPDQPFAARTTLPTPETAKVEDLIQAVELKLHQNPEDGQGWDVIGPVYMKQGRFQEAADAFANATRILGETTRRLAGFAESTVLANDGIVTEPARSAYEKLRKLEPARIEPRFWLALAKEQDGRLDAAMAEFQALLKDAPADATWQPMVIERIDTVREKLGLAAAAPAKAPALAPAPAPAQQPPVAAKPATAERGPSASDVAAADKMAPADRRQMIEGMVQGLAERLKKDGRDLAGWQRLIRAYSVMGRKADAVAALGKARDTFKAEPQSLDALKILAQSLGLDS